MFAINRATALRSDDAVVPASALAPRTTRWLRARRAGRHTRARHMFIEPSGVAGSRPLHGTLTESPRPSEESAIVLR